MEETKRFPPCGVDSCKETLFSLENGQWFCKNGHLKEGELETAADDEQLGTQGSRAGRIRVEKAKLSKVLRGRKGFELYLQCYQIILQKQVWWLIHEKKFPEELEIVVRDLWALQLDILSSTVPSNNRSQEKPDASSQDAASASGYSSQSSYLYTSEDESGSTNVSAQLRRKRQVPKASDRPKLTTSVGLCYLGLLLLRAGACLGDMQRWVETENGLPFMRAIKEVPPTMKDKLSAEYWRALDPGARPKRGVLYRTVQELIISLQIKYGMTFPPINSSLLLSRYITDLGLPLEIYTATKRLSEHLFQSFSWPPVAKQRRTSNWPEARLMALVIISTKLCCGLDETARVPKTNVEAGAITLDWGAWEKFLREGNDRRRGLLADGGFESALEVDVKEVDVFAMDKDKLDQYMDWYERTWCGPGDINYLSEGLLKLFATDRHTGQRVDDNDEARALEPSVERQNATTTDADKIVNRIRALHGSSMTKPAKPLGEDRGTGAGVILSGSDTKDSVVRPGQNFLWYAMEEDLPHQLQILMQAAADLLAIERGDFWKVVRSLETQLREDVKERSARRRDSF